MRLLLTGGGTAGHVYPALSVVDELNKLPLGNALAGAPGRGSGRDHRPDARVDFLWVGSTGGMEESLVPRAGLPYTGIPAGGVRGMGPVTLARNVGRLSQGFAQARGILARYRPHAVFATGGYVGVPVVLAARLARIPSLVYLPDIEPGLAVRALARLVDRVCVSFEASRRYLPAAKVVATGYPVRAELKQPGDKTQARQALGLIPDLPTVLIFGGSRGARRINQAAVAAASRLVGRAQVVHVSGEGEHAAVRDGLAALDEAGRARYHLYPYLHGEMVHALRAADLVVSRAGAATLGEYPMVGLPAILVPLPIAGGHQWPNAQFLVDAGGAVAVSDAELDGDRLWREVSSALADPAQLQTRAQAMRTLARPDAARRIALELAQLAAHSPQGQETVSFVRGGV